MLLPECDLDAMNINNDVYRLLKDFAENGLITHELSHYWQASTIEFDYHGKVYTDLYYPNSHGMASSLTTYTFFYSQYHQMLLSVAEFIDSNSIRNPEAIDNVYTTLEVLRDEFTTQYNMCIRSHPHPKIYYERGMLRMHSGKTEDALMDVNRLMRMAKTDRYKDRMILTTEMYQQEGELYADLGRYDKAITSLSEAIRLDPNNRGAYFSRAQAYFETGEFEQSLDDYLASKSHSGVLKAKLKPSWTVKESILKGLQEGCAQAVVDFVPSLCSSVYGLCSSMWIFAQHPIDSTTQFANACYDIGNCINEFRKNVDLEEIESYPIEIQRLYDQFDRLSESEKGHLVGYVVGRYGVDIFAGGTAIKGIAAFKKLRDANRMCMLETMTISEINKEAVIASALKHKTEREAFFKNVKLHVDRQNKHIVGKHNFEFGKSEFVHSDPQALLSNFAGKGQPINNKIPGNPDYRERIDFREFIGYYVNDKNPEVKLPTTKGIIRYSKKGAHIIPSHPEGI
jgi:tetratricopeptide (TPR) repeat protein